MGAILRPGGRVTVLGAGRSGMAAATLLREQGVCIFISDNSRLSASARLELLSREIPFEESGHTERALAHAELIVLSPGISSQAPIIQQALRHGIPIWSELELAYRFCPSRKIIAVTGTNGKSTTTLLIERLLAKAGHPTVSAGNLGVPLSAKLKEITPQTIVVLEVSSFQLEFIESFRPRVAIFLNFAPNHLDRHKTLANYWAAKCRIFENQRAEDFLVFPRELSQAIQARAQLICYDELLPELRALAGTPHWARNAAAALAAARVFAPQLPPPAVADFPQLAHRQEFVAAIQGVKFYDDSKATTIHATLAALEAIPKPLVLILGGRDKNLDFAPLAQALQRYEVREVLLVGEAAPKIARALQQADSTRFVYVQSLDEAVERALRYPGANCLLSPACASFDQFSNYEERGNAFRQAVLRVRSIPSPPGPPLPAPPR